jgi:hypothetical protein
MNTDLYRGLKFAIPLSLMLWALIIAGVARAAEPRLPTVRPATTPNYPEPRVGGSRAVTPTYPAPRFGAQVGVVGRSYSFGLHARF